MSAHGPQRYRDMHRTRHGWGCMHPVVGSSPKSSVRVRPPPVPPSWQWQQISETAYRQWPTSIAPFNSSHFWPRARCGLISPLWSSATFHKGKFLSDLYCGICSRSPWWRTFSKMDFPHRHWVEPPMNFLMSALSNDSKISSDDSDRTKKRKWQRTLHDTRRRPSLHGKVFC